MIPSAPRKPYSTDVIDDEWDFVAPCPTLMTPDAKHGCALLSRCWVVERSFAWIARFRRLARDYERLPESLARLHFMAFACLMLQSLLTVAFKVHKRLKWLPQGI